MQLQVPRAGYDIIDLETPIPDLQTLSTDDDDTNSHTLMATGVRIIGVHSLEVTYNCLG